MGYVDAGRCYRTQLLRALRGALAIAVICGNDSIDRARTGTAWSADHLRLQTA